MAIIRNKSGEAAALTFSAADLKPRRKKPVQREHQEQEALFYWAKLRSQQTPELSLMFAIPNGGHRHKAVAARLRAEGVRAGVPDICLPVARNGFHGLFIELKAPGGRATDTQRQWMAALADQGYCVKLCVGWEAAKQAIEVYLTEKDPADDLFQKSD